MQCGRVEKGPQGVVIRFYRSQVENLLRADYGHLLCVLSWCVFTAKRNARRLVGVRFYFQQFLHQSLRLPSLISTRRHFTLVTPGTLIGERFNRHAKLKRCVFQTLRVIAVYLKGGTRQAVSGTLSKVDAHVFNAVGPRRTPKPPGNRPRGWRGRRGRCRCVALRGGRRGGCRP